MVYIVPDAPIPAPDKRGRRARPYPFEQLEIGQSLMVANKDNMPAGEAIEQASTLTAIRTAVSREHKRTPEKTYRSALFATDNHWLQIWREK